MAAYLTAGLSEIIPSESIIVEDGDPIIGDPAASTWVIDPIDGTIPFMYHIPSYMVSIYQLKEGAVVSAYAYDPNSGNIYHTDSSRSCCNGIPIQVSQRSRIVEARIALSSYTLETLPRLYATLREAGAYIIVQEGLVFRSTLVASGYIDATIQVGLKQFESGAVHGLVTNAGGQVKSSVQDSIEFLQTSPYVVISNNNLSNVLLSILRQVVKGATA